MGADLSALLKESWTLVEEDQERVAGYFYAHIFTAHPHLRDMFPVQMQLQRERLLSAIVSTVHGFNDLERTDTYLRQLGRDHKKFSVEPEHYALVKSALLRALRYYARGGWNLQFEQAWSDVYDLIAAKMIAGANEDDSPPYWYAEVVAHERRGRDVAVFTCRPLRPMLFEPGQYCSLETHYQPRMWRTYSMANAPRPDNTIDFHVRALDSGWVSGPLVWRLRPGDLIKMAAPMGSMTLDRQSKRDIVCVAGGTGLAPIKAIIDELSRHHNRSRFVHLFRGVRTRDDLYDRAHLDELVAAYPWLVLTRAVSDDPTFAEAEHGNVSDVLRRTGPWQNHDFYVCGSPAMVSATLRAISDMNVPRMRVRYDTFA
ncbi:globin domain-containing protein [Catelliglobosispora koreensis]|uniref:globin domain-containing protein n=1 Tax=Catelliglobosispora koreensis TaxID=129052 RepID=UPI00037E05FB|nr:globin domain-containing protein [Catelliglobosispora koreensis]